MLIHPKIASGGIWGKKNTFRALKILKLYSKVAEAASATFEYSFKIFGERNVFFFSQKTPKRVFDKDNYPVYISVMFSDVFWKNPVSKFFFEKNSKS